MKANDNILWSAARVNSRAAVFNLYVNGLQVGLPSRSIEYADDTTICETVKPDDLQTTPNKVNFLFINITLDKLEQWSNENSLAINATKTL